MNDFEGISQETVDSIRADIESTQRQQEEETLEAVGVSPDQPIEEPAPQREIALFWRKTSPKKEIFMEIADELKNILKN